VTPQSHDPISPRAPAVRVWSPDCSATIDLTRLGGPRQGVIHPPPHLLPARPGIGWDLADRGTKVQLYQACLRGGRPYEIYRWVNLPDLVELWPALELPARIAHPWTRGLRDAGLLMP
jgi:hypothetical protein